MRRKKSREKISGSGATVKGKWPYYDVMNFFEYYLQRRTTTGNVQRQRLQLKIHSPIQMKLKWAILNNWKEKICHYQKMEGGWSKNEQPAGIKRGREERKIKRCWYRQTIFGLLERNW